MINKTDLQAFEYYNVLDDLDDNKKPTVFSMVDEFANKMGQPKDFEMSSQLFLEELEELADAVSKWRLGGASKEEVAKEMSDVEYTLHGMARAFGYNMAEGTYRVHKNNLGRCIQLDGTIKRREDGKVLKNKDYPKVVLSDLVE